MDKQDNRTEYLLEVEDLRVEFPVGGGFLRKEKQMLRAVDGVSFKIKPGETWGSWGNRAAANPPSATRLSGC